MKLWLLPEPVQGSAHRFKYSLFYGYPGLRAVAYDNERGKGDHRHSDGWEKAYAFESLDRLLADFETDVRGCGPRRARMADEMKIMVGGSLKDDLAAFRSAWERTEHGEQVKPERVLAFESWEALARVLTRERHKLLRHLHAHPEPSISALARHLGRHLRRVQADVRALESAGLVDRSAGDVRVAADRLTAEIEL